MEQVIDTLPYTLLLELDHYCKLILSPEEYAKKDSLHPVTWINHMAQDFEFGAVEKQQLLEVSSSHKRLELLILFLKSYFAKKSFGHLAPMMPPGSVF